MVQWVKDSASVARVAVKVQVQFLAWLSGLRIQCFHSCDTVCSYCLDSIPGPGTLICCGCGQKKKTPKNPTKPKKPHQQKQEKNRITTSLCFCRLILCWCTPGLALSLEISLRWKFKVFSGLVWSYVIPGSACGSLNFPMYMLPWNVLISQSVVTHFSPGL